MRIGVDLTSAVTQGGGIGRYTRELIHAVTQLDLENEYRFFSAKQPLKLPVPNSIPQGNRIRYRQSPLEDKWHYRIWYRLRIPIPVQLLTGQIDLFHSPDFVLPPVLPKVPTLLTVHDLSFLHYPNTFPDSLVAYLNQVVPWSIKRATHILADSEATKRDLESLWQISPEKITVLLSGVTSSFSIVDEPTQIERVKAKYGLGNAPYLLSVGTIQPRKNFQFLIRAFKPIADRFPHNLIFSGGKGWMYDEMLAEVEKQNLRERVRFIGFVDDVDLPALYSGASLFVFPSLYEGFGLPLLEAMACGVPVLSSDASSLPEVGQNTAVYCSPHDLNGWTENMNDLLGDQDRLQHLSQKGKAHVAQFTWQKTAVQLLNIYEKIKEST
ncbi:MAG: glycosyltransferase family 1 protein [Chloroflexota bacterium]